MLAFFQDECHQISIPLYEILSLDERQMIVRVEPNVSVRDLTHFLTPKGYTLAVTLEIGDATAGGLAFGVGMTTYSHNVGLYQETIVSYDVVMASGQLIHVTRDEHSDLFCKLITLHLSILPLLRSLFFRFSAVVSWNAGISCCAGASNYQNKALCARRLYTGMRAPKHN